MRSIETPLGDIHFDATTQGRADIHVVKLPPVLENGMTLDRVIACVLVVEPDIEGADLVFSAKLPFIELHRKNRSVAHFQ